MQDTTLVYRNETDLSERLTSQNKSRDAFDSALTGCRITLAALNLEFGKLIEPKQLGKSKQGTIEMGFQAKARLVWKEDIMKQLLDHMRTDGIVAVSYHNP